MIWKGLLRTLKVRMKIWWSSLFSIRNSSKSPNLRKGISRWQSVIWCKACKNSSSWNLRGIQQYLKGKTQRNSSTMPRWSTWRKCRISLWILLCKLESSTLRRRKKIRWLKIRIWKSLICKKWCLPCQKRWLSSISGLRRWNRILEITMNLVNSLVMIWALLQELVETSLEIKSICLRILGESMTLTFSI